MLDSLNNEDIIVRSLFSFTLSEMRDHFVENELPRFAADQVYQWIHRHFEFDFSKWSNVSKKVKAFLIETLSDSLPKVVWHGLSKDGTRKFLIGFSDSQTVEAVAIPAKNNRLTLCISSQVGCAIGSVSYTHLTLPTTPYV